MFRTDRLPLRLERLDDRALPAPLTGAGGIYSPALGQLSWAEQASIYDTVYNKNTIDVRVANGTLFITGTPQSDTVDVANDSTVNTANGVQGSNSLYADANAYSRIEFNGGGGYDTFTYAGSRPVLARGGDSDDTLIGGGGADLLVGDLGADTLNGRGGSDVAWGDGQGQISGSAPDGVNGSTMTDTMYGEDGDDYLYGGFGNDKLYGGNNNDVLNGGDQDDFLEGGAGLDALGQQGFYYLTYTYFPYLGWLPTGTAFAETASENGNDRLFGGANDGADTLRGGAGFDRLLAPADRTSTGGLTYEDSLPDFDAAADARPTLVDGYSTTVTLSGVSTTYTARQWTDADVNRTDAVFGVLQDGANGKTTLLKRANGGDLVIVRHGSTNRGYNEGGTNWIHMTDAGLQYGDTSANDVNLRGYILHEIGHNWQGSAFSSGGVNYWSQFVGLSGWTSTQPSAGQLGQYTLSTNEGNGSRWYLTSATFASTYARTNENEDFAESFAAYFSQRAGWTYYNGGAGAAAIPAKMSIFSTWASYL